MSKIKRVTPNDTKAKEKFVITLIDWLATNDLWYDTCIYANNKRYASTYIPPCPIIKSKPTFDPTNKTCTSITTPKTNTDVYVTSNVDATDYIEYANPELITMSFEGPLYTALNYESDGRTERALEKLFEQ